MKKLAILMVCAVALFSCGKPKTKVKYEVTGTGGDYRITYAGPGGNVMSLTDQDAGWTYEFEAEQGVFVRLSAENGKDSGTVVAKIYTNGTVFKEDTKSGKDAKVEVSGNLP
jgi:hypothetical protein